jgi:hypothetical protein
MISRCENVCSARITSYICRAVKPSTEPAAAAEAPHGEAVIDPAYRIAAE